MAYVALEPLIRRKWPQGLISWTRLLSGRLRDPLLGRDVLVGTLTGAASALLSVLWILVLPDCGAVQGAPLPSGISWMAGSLAGSLWLAATAILLTAVFFTMLWRLLRSRWAAAAAVWLLCLLLSFVVSGVDAGGWVVGTGLAIMVAASLLVLLRVGVAAACATLAVSMILTAAPTGFQFSAWHQNAGQLFAAVVLLLAVYGFRTALGGRRLFSAQAQEW